MSETKLEVSAELRDLAKKAIEQAEQTFAMCAVILAFGGLWLEFFRNVAALPSALMFWHFHL
jgi:hypothetical protein